MLLRTPLYDWHVAHGGRMVEFGGWDMPVQYSTIVEEHTAVRTAAGLFDISHMGRLVFQGPEAEALLQHLFTNDVATMKPGQVRYGLVCNEQGGILDDVLVYKLQPFWLMVVNASNRVKIVDWIKRQQGSRDVKVTDMTTRWAMIAVQGPRAITPELVAGWRLNGDPGALRYYFASVSAAPKDGRSGDDLGEGYEILSRTGYTGEDGFEIIVGASRVQQVVETGFAAYSYLKPCGLGARDTLRLEAAMPLYGHELSEEIDPLQAGLGWAVKLDKGEFLGREALLRRQQDPKRRVRVGLELDGRRIAREGADVLADTGVIGRVTSGTFGPTLNKAVAMAFVDPAHAAVGTVCQVDVRGKQEGARVVPLPFYRRAKT
jgi:aminomethyltransferase